MRGLKALLIGGFLNQGLSAKVDKLNTSHEGN